MCAIRCRTYRDDLRHRGLYAASESRSLLLFQQRFEVREWAIGRPLAGRARSARARLCEVALVLVLVTVGAQQFPVAAVGRIVVVIVIAMVHLEQAHVREREFPRTAAADPGIHPERKLAIAAGALVARAPCVGYDAVQASVVRYRLPRHTTNYITQMSFFLDPTRASRNSVPSDRRQVK